MFWTRPPKTFANVNLKVDVSVIVSFEKKILYFKQNRINKRVTQCWILPEMPHFLAYWKAN
jgi:hypothetical protein